MIKRNGSRFSIFAILFRMQIGLAFLAIGCRPPQMPVLQNDRNVIQYDTAYEEQLRSGKPLRFGLDGMQRYVDTLAEPVAISEWSADHCQWEVFVATNRGCFESTDDPLASNRVLSQAQYGRCDVRLPRNDIGLRMYEEANRQQANGELATYSSDQKKSPRKSSARQPIQKEVKASQLSKAAFLDGVSQQVQQSRQKDILVFVHGFNVSFEEAIAGTAELALNIPFNGSVVSYCWPSQGGVMNYSVDEPINQASVAPFTEFVETLQQGIPNARIHIVVHSMGNRIVMQSLSHMHSAGTSKKFGHIVLCAPDVGVEDFLNWAPGVVTVSEHVTLYANASDQALIASKGLHAESRAGDALSPLVVPGIETIDCSRIDSSLLGHSYFCENDDVTSDLFLLVKENLSPNQRPHLTKLRTANGHYWQFADHAPNVMCTWNFKNLK